MTNNLSVWERNMTIPFAHNDIAFQLYLRGKGSEDGFHDRELKAFDCAMSWLRVEPVLRIVEKGGDYPQSAIDEMVEFVAERHFRTYFKGN